MTGWLWGVVGTLAYVLLFVGWLDRRQAPAWEVRDNYRLVSMGLFFIALLSILKALQYHTELVTLMPFCK